jgi:hypothetical protein
MPFDNLPQKPFGDIELLMEARGRMSVAFSERWRAC